MDLQITIKARYFRPVLLHAGQDVCRLRSRGREVHDWLIDGQL